MVVRFFPLFPCQEYNIKNTAKPKEMRLDMVDEKKGAGTITFSLRLELTEGLPVTSFPKLLITGGIHRSWKNRLAKHRGKAIKATAGVDEMAEEIKYGYNDCWSLFGMLEKAVNLVDEIAAVIYSLIWIALGVAIY